MVVRCIRANFAIFKCAVCSVLLFKGRLAGANSVPKGGIKKGPSTLVQAAITTQQPPGARREMTEVEFRRLEAGRETEPTAQIRPTIKVRAGRRLATETRKRAKEPPFGASLHHAATERRKQRNYDHDETPRAARPPPRLVRRSASGIGGLVDRAALKRAIAIRSPGNTARSETW